MTIKPHQCLQYIEVLEAVMLQPGPVSGLGLGRKQLEGYNLQMGKNYYSTCKCLQCNIVSLLLSFLLVGWGADTPTPSHWVRQ